MSNTNIQIQQKDTNGYAPLYIENDAANIGGMNVDSRYNDTNALTTLQGIANRTIAPDGAYWYDITSTIGEFANAKLCCYGNFVALYLTDPNTPTAHKFTYSYSRGKVWRTATLPTLYDASDILCYPTYSGYRVEVVSDPSKVGLAEHVNFSHNLFNDVMGYNHLTDEYLNYIGLQKVSAHITPYGFLFGMEKSGTIDYEMLSYLYTDNQITDVTTGDITPSIWTGDFESSEYALTIDSDYDNHYTIYDNKNGGLITLYTKQNGSVIDFKLVFSPMYEFGKEDKSFISSELGNFVGCGNALNTAFFLFNNQIYCCDYRNNIIWQIPLPNATSTWKYIFGNRYRLYLVSTEGDIAYLNDINDDWHIADQSISLDPSTGLSTLKELTNSSITSFEAVTDDENTYIYAVVNGNKILRSTVYNYQ